MMMRYFSPLNACLVGLVGLAAGGGRGDELQHGVQPPPLQLPPRQPRRVVNILLRLKPNHNDTGI